MPTENYTTNQKELKELVKSALGTKFSSQWSDMMCDLAITAVRTVVTDSSIDIKRFARVEKVPGGEITDSTVLRGVMINKDVVHSKMRRSIQNPRILLLDCGLEYKKGESQTNIEIEKEEDWQKILHDEEKQIKAMCDLIIEKKPDLVISEKGISDLAQHYFVKNNISAIRRVRKTDNLRIARAVGARIVNRLEDLNESDLGTGAKEFKVDKIGDDYFAFINKCSEPKACTIILRGPNKDVLNELERNLMDAMCIARNIIQHPYCVPGAGALEMMLSTKLLESASKQGEMMWAYKEFAKALQVIPRTLIMNCGCNSIKVLTELQNRHINNEMAGINGLTGEITASPEIYESVQVKKQIIKTAVEAACLLLRVDDIVSGKRMNKPQQED